MCIYPEFTMKTESLEENKFNNWKTKTLNESDQKIASYIGYISWEKIQRLLLISKEQIEKNATIF